MNLYNRESADQEMATHGTQTNKNNVAQANSALTPPTNVAKKETKSRLTMTKLRSTNRDLVSLRKRGCARESEPKVSEDTETIAGIHQKTEHPQHTQLDTFSHLPSITTSGVRKVIYTPCARLDNPLTITSTTLSSVTPVPTPSLPSSDSASRDPPASSYTTSNSSLTSPAPSVLTASLPRAAPSSGRLCWIRMAVLLGVLVLTLMSDCEAARGSHVTCVCTTSECLAAGVRTCVTESLCYAQLLDLRDGTHPITRGCFPKRQKSPLLCMNHPPAVDLDTWPYLVCCATDLCNRDVNPTAPPPGFHTRHTSESASALQSVGASSIEEVQPRYGDTSSTWLHVTYLCVITVALALMIIISGAGLRIVRKYRLQEAQNKFGYEAPEAVALTTP